MQVYTIEGQGDLRLITLLSSASHRFRFYSKETGKRIKLTKDGSRLKAIVRGKIVVKKNPNANQFHFEYMQANRGSLSRGEGGADSERILENMLECVEVV